MFIRYIGTSNSRVITARQFDEAGVPDQELVVWNESNAYTINGEVLSDDAIALLERDPALVFIDDPRDPEEAQAARIAAGVRRIRARAVAAATAS